MGYGRHDPRVAEVGPSLTLMPRPPTVLALKYVSAIGRRIAITEPCSRALRPAGQPQFRTHALALAMC